MRMPNCAIKRERHPTPTVDDLIHAMNGAKVFSKLGLRSGYHQLILDEESRYITTFATHKGLYRYTRLNFGTNAASEIFQKVIHDEIHDIPGALNISDEQEGDVSDNIADEINEEEENEMHMQEQRYPARDKRPVQRYGQNIYEQWKAKSHGYFGVFYH